MYAKNDTQPGIVCTAKNLEWDWRELSITEDVWPRQPANVLRSMLFQLHLIRAFEVKLCELKKQSLIHGPVHTSVGQEAIAVGAMAALRPADGISGTHRAHHQFLAKACSYYLTDHHDPCQEEVPEKLQSSINSLLAEVMGLSKGCCKGRGGSMHLCDPAIGVLGTDAIVGGGIPLATGAAFAKKYQKTSDVVLCFFGDGAINQGSFHESLNLAGLWKLPVVYILENNFYAVATNLEQSVPIKELSIRGASYGMPAWIVDGMNPLAMKLAVQEAAKAIRDGGPPILIDAKTYRFFHHAGDIPGSAFGYRKKDEEKEWKKRDPIENFAKEMQERKILSDAEEETLQVHAENAIQKAVTFCLETNDEGKLTVRPGLIPSNEEVTEGLRSDGSEFEGIAFVESVELPCKKEMKYVEAIATVIGQWMEQDPNVVVLGEEVGHMKGGAYMATKGLTSRFPGRVWDTPISEAGFTGLGGGAAMTGLKPIVEIMFPDFALVAADQIFNQIGKLRYMYGGDNVDMPIVLRTRVAIGCGYGGQHSMDPTALFALFSGWQIVTPTTPADYIGLFNSAMQSKDPVVIIEHHEFYNQTGLVPDTLDYFIKIGKAAKVHDGDDVTVLTHSWMTALVTKAAEELAGEGISVDAIDLRTLSMQDIDYETIEESLRKTKNMVIVEQSPSSNSIGPRLAGGCQRRFFDCLSGPIVTLAGLDIPAPVSRWAEARSVPTVESIKDTIRKAVQRQS